MAQAAITITPTGGDPIEFEEQINAPGRYAIRLTPSAPVHELQEFHASGVDGNFIVDHGRTGQSIALEVHYIGPYEDVVANYAADCDALVGVFCTLEDGASGKTYDRLLLMDDAPIQGEPRTTVAGNYICRVRYLFARK